MCGQMRTVKSGRCQNVQSTPSSSSARAVPKRSCSRGCAKPRQPGSSPTGPADVRAIHRAVGYPLSAIQLRSKALPRTPTIAASTGNARISSPAAAKKPMTAGRQPVAMRPSDQLPSAILLTSSAARAGAKVPGSIASIGTATSRRARPSRPSTSGSHASHASVYARRRTRTADVCEPNARSSRMPQPRHANFPSRISSGKIGIIAKGSRFDPAGIGANSATIRDIRAVEGRERVATGLAAVLVSERRGW